MELAARGRDVPDVVEDPDSTIQARHDQSIAGTGQTVVALDRLVQSWRDTGRQSVPDECGRKRIARYVEHGDPLLAERHVHELAKVVDRHPECDVLDGCTEYRKFHDEIDPQTLNLRGDENAEDEQREVRIRLVDDLPVDDSRFSWTRAHVPGASEEGDVPQRGVREGLARVLTAMEPARYFVETRCCRWGGIANGVDVQAAAGLRARWRNRGVIVPVVDLDDPVHHLTGGVLRRRQRGRCAQRKASTLARQEGSELQRILRVRGDVEDERPRCSRTEDPRIGTFECCQSVCGLGEDNG